MPFRYPAFFLLFLILPLLWYFLRKNRHAAAFTFSDISLTQGTPGSWRVQASRVLPFLRAAILGLFIVSLARPQVVNQEREHETKGIDIIISLDISGSMLAEDFKPENRLAVAKQEAEKFIRNRENDRIGLVVFARDAFTQCPLTTDYEILIGLLQQIQIGMIPDGTAIGMGIATAVNRLRDNDAAKSKVIILLTDGENNAGKIDPVTAAELAHTFGIKIYTIGVGRGGLVPFPINDPLFGKRYVQAKVEVDEFVLKRIADITGGIFFRARDPKSLSEIYSKINQLEKTEVKVTEYQSFDERFHYFLIPALILLLLELVMKNSVLLKIP